VRVSTDAVVRATWQLHLRLEAEQVDAPGVHWILFERDPMLRFEQELVARARSCREWLDRIQDAAVREHTRLAFLRAAWDHAFQSLVEDGVHLAPCLPDDGSGHTFNAAPGRKWVATRATRAAQCWCVPVDVAAGQLSEVVLRDSNATSLAERCWP
jgi:hypothetical protein